jgi:hypothetical protein
MKLSNGVVILSIPDFSKISARAKIRWRNLINALNSGAYKQEKGRLRGKSRFCCMGVACDLVKNGNMTWKGTKFVTLSGFEERILPKFVQDLYEFTFGAGFTVLVQGSRRRYASLTTLNDYGATFYDIADILEKALNGGYRAIGKR